MGIAGNWQPSHLLETHVRLLVWRAYWVWWEHHGYESHPTHLIVQASPQKWPYCWHAVHKISWSSLDLCHPP